MTQCRRIGIRHIEIYNDRDSGRSSYVIVPITDLARVIDALRQLEQDIALCTTDTSNGDPATDQNSNRRHDS